MALPCEGAPRDLGLDQGRALVGRIRARVRLDLGSTVDRFLRPPGSEPLARRVEIDTRRFYPHMYERMCGLSRGAGVPVRDLAALLSRELAVTSPVGLVVVGPERGGGVARIARRVQAADVFLRRSEPGGDYRSLEWVRPGIVPALAGVNEHGLAVAASVAPPTPEALARCAAPAGLLVQDCLQRFDALEKAVEWCLARPSGGRVSIALADEKGDVAVVHRTGPDAHIERPTDGLAIASQRDREREVLAKRCGEHATLDAAGLVRVLCADVSPTPSVVLLEPAGRRLCLAVPGVPGAGSDGLDWRTLPPSAEVDQPEAD